MGSKEPRPLPKPGEPGYQSPYQPRLASPPPPRKRTWTPNSNKCCHELHADKLTAENARLTQQVAELQQYIEQLEGRRASE